MAMFKCKMCGGALEIAGNESVATCEYCGTQQTVGLTKDGTMVAVGINAVGQCSISDWKDLRMP